MREVIRLRCPECSQSKNKRIGAYRPAADRDRPHFEKYAEGALTEFDAMCGGLEKVFGLGEYQRTAVCNDNLFVKVKFTKKQKKTLNVDPYLI